ncbi:ATP-binding protein [Actinomadura sp. LD22]|uniref:ATP-binding protein n=1 Tax=Actinomadura physcomitrii TaxID=2650748 RepID=A0A6I4MQQ0_9ACTN|nr:ATP-binding protein [Actinomadura physcomitrii]MWA04596.1 ATP-binding protein [Actinomadura physcomitrii]
MKATTMFTETSDTLVLEPTSQAPEAAQRFVSAHMKMWGLDDFDGRLVASELVTNAFLHGAGAIVVRLFREETKGLPTVEVSDQGARLPTLRQENYAATSGRGLLMVAAVSAAWGVRPPPAGGKSVWALLAI